MDKRMLLLSAGVALHQTMLVGKGSDLELMDMILSDRDEAVDDGIRVITMYPNEDMVVKVRDTRPYFKKPDYRELEYPGFSRRSQLLRNASRK